MKQPKIKPSVVLEAECIVWNDHYSVGTLVDFHPVIGEPKSRPGHTTTKAQVLGGHTAVVWLDSESGCVALDACEARRAQGGGDAER